MAPRKAQQGQGSGGADKGPIYRVPRDASRHLTASFCVWLTLMQALKPRCGEQGEGPRVRQGVVELPPRPTFPVPSALGEGAVLDSEAWEKDPGRRQMGPVGLCGVGSLNKPHLEMQQPSADDGLAQFLNYRQL